MNISMNRTLFENMSKPLTSLNEQELAEVFEVSPQDNMCRVERFYRRLLQANNRQENKKIMGAIAFQTNKQDNFDTNAIKNITNSLAEELFIYFENIKKRKIINKFKVEFNLSKKFEFELITPTFLEAYKMYSNLNKNKNQGKELLENYLEKKTFPFVKNIFNSYPFTKSENQTFIKNIKKKVNVKQWYRANKKIIPVASEDQKDTVYESVTRHLNVANENLKQLGLSQQESAEDLINFYSNLNFEDFNESQDNLLNDLKHEISQLKQLQNSTQPGKTFDKVAIYHELDPIRILMMGEWVERSCLVFTEENNWSVFTNALEANKTVFYIEGINGENEEGNIIGRVLCAITNEGELIRFPLYNMGNPKVDINKYFNEYIKELARQCRLKITNKDKRNNVELLFCDGWYSDPQENFNQ